MGKPKPSTLTIEILTLTIELLKFNNKSGGCQSRPDRKHARPERKPEAEGGEGGGWLAGD